MEAKPYPGDGEQIRDAKPADCQNPAIRQLLEYWLAQRGSRRFPARADLDPLQMRYALGNIVLFERLPEPAAAEPRYRFRLVGSDIATRAGYDATSKVLNDLPPSDYRRLILARLGALTADPAPLLIRNADCYDDRWYDYEAIWLPLAANGEDVDMFMAGQIFAEEPPARYL